MDIVFFRGFRIAPAHFVALFRMVQPVVDALGQRLRILGRKQAMLVQGELGGGCQLSLRNHGDNRLLEGFQGRKTFDLDGGTVDVQIGLRRQFAEPVPVMELEDGIILDDTVLV